MANHVRRRNFNASLSAFAASCLSMTSTRHVLAALGVKPGRFGVCSFSCHRAWQAVRDNSAIAPFTDGSSFYDYARSIGADGVQTSLRIADESAATRFREHVESTGGYCEGDIRLPMKESELESFEQEVKLTLASGASVARTVLSGSRRYETWKSMDDFNAFRFFAAKRLAWVEPIARKHGLKLAVENHKDLTSKELAQLMRDFSSEWIGVNVDTGNNIALLEDPNEVVETLAPFAMSVHLKDMAVQPHEQGFLLSEVTCGQGFLDLPRIVAVLNKANSDLSFSLEMATRDPLLVPCLADGFFVTFPERKSTHLENAMQRIKANPLKQPPPSIVNKPMQQQLVDEEANNRGSLKWLHNQLKDLG
ncbi:MAG TPA: TIM barrel protein [Pirellula sp.]|nr:TIM barrel protein [Pirellula sp.]